MTMLPKTSSLATALVVALLFPLAAGAEPLRKMKATPTQNPYAIRSDLRAVPDIEPAAQALFERIWSKYECVVGARPGLTYCYFDSAGIEFVLTDIGSSNATFILRRMNSGSQIAVEAPNGCVHITPLVGPEAQVYASLRTGLLYADLDACREGRQPPPAPKK